jgi:competence protein ComGC
MKKNKGFTVFELLVGFIFLIIIGYFLLVTIFSIRDKQQLNVIKSKLIDFKTTVTSDIEMDLMKYRFISQATCGTNCIDITFANGLVKRLQIDVGNNKITYGDSQYDLVENSYFVPPFTFSTQVINDTFTGRKNSVFEIIIPIEHDDVKGSYGINIISPYNANDVITPLSLTIIGGSSINANIGETFLDPGATAYSPNDGDITSKIVVTNNVNIDVIGTYSITYEVEDSTGLTAMAMRTVRVMPAPAEYAYTGDIKTYTISHAGIYKITTIGAKGGGTNGGKGASMIGEFNLSAGTILKVLVGQQGSYINPYLWSAGGGGGSYVVKKDDASSYTMTDGTKVTPLVIAGGGGGAYTSNPTVTDASTGTDGKSGAGYSFAAGATGGNSSPSASYGSGGGGFLVDTNSTTLGRSFLSGGAGGTSTASTPGGFGGGGGAFYSSSYNSTCDCDRNRCGAGGGGGYSGGGYGFAYTTDSMSTDGYGGGGGSYNAGTNQVNTAGVGTGNGYVKIEMISGS